MGQRRYPKFSHKMKSHAKLSPLNKLGKTYQVGSKNREDEEQVGRHNNKKKTRVASAEWLYSINNFYWCKNKVFRNDQGFGDLELIKNYRTRKTRHK